MSVVHVTCSYGYEYRATPTTGVSSGQEAPKTASLSLTVLRVQHYSLKKFTDSSVRMFNDMDQTRCPIYAPIVRLHKKKKLIHCTVKVQRCPLEDVTCIKR